MEQTTLHKLLEWCKEFEDKQVKPTFTNMKEKIWQLLPIEEKQLCRMYEQGRKDNHLDYYPEKHAKETYVEFYVYPKFKELKNGSYKFTKKDWSIEEMLDLLAAVLK